MYCNTGFNILGTSMYLFFQELFKQGRDGERCSHLIDTEILHVPCCDTQELSDRGDSFSWIYLLNTRVKIVLRIQTFVQSVVLCLICALRSLVG
jgi:hypothetical protein